MFSTSSIILTTGCGLLQCERREQHFDRYWSMTHWAALLWIMDNLVLYMLLLTAAASSSTKIIPFTWAYVETPLARKNISLSSPRLPQAGCICRRLWDSTFVIYSLVGSKRYKQSIATGEIRSEILELYARRIPEGLTVKLHGFKAFGLYFFWSLTPL